MENEQEKTITRTININILLYPSIYLTHLQATSSTVKSHNHSTQKMIIKKKAWTATEKRKGGKKASSGSGGLTVDYTKKRDVFCLLS